MKVHDFDLESKFRQEEGTILLSGVQALVRLPIDQHRLDARRGLRTATFISGYPGSPLAGLDLQLQQKSAYLSEHDIAFVPGVNEELAATAVWGSQQEMLGQQTRYDGLLGMWFGKGPGIDRCGDAFKHANFMGVSRNGGVLAVGGDDPSAKSSTLPSQSEPTFFDALMPTLYPGNIQEVLDLGLHGFALSRYSGCWVGFKIVTNLADGIGTAEVSPHRINPVDPSFELDGKPWVHVQNPMLLPPLSLEREREIYHGRLEAAKAYASANGLNTIAVKGQQDWLGIVAAGKTYYDLREALAGMGLDERDLQRLGIRLLKVGMVFPFEAGIVHEFARGLREIIVIEEKRSFIELFLRDTLYNLTNHPIVLGKKDEEGRPLVSTVGELTADQIALTLARRFERYPELPSMSRVMERLETPTALPASLPVVRQPYFCSGCPHNRSTHVPEDSIGGAGVGCHTMAMWMDRSTVAMVQMGGEGAFWIGRQPFVDLPHVVQNLGDGTAFHSGTLAIRAALAAGLNMTYKILYNGHVAMTGGQEVTGVTSVPDLTRALDAEGVKKIIVCAEDPKHYGRKARWAPGVEVLDRSELDDAQLRLSREKGVTALIFDQQCAAEKRRSRKRGKLEDPPTRVIINEAVCEGCGDCGEKSNCLSVQPVETEFGRKTQIHQSSCNKDYSCLEGDCPSFVTVEVKEERSKTASVPQVSVALPEPPTKEPVAEHSFYMTGVGGTGVVTVNQLLATAALLDGWYTSGLDQTGLAQKGGPVVSHLKISREPAAGSGMVATGLADCYLGFDILVAADSKHLARADSNRTVAVVSTTEVPTGAMISDTNLAFPEESDLVTRIDKSTRKDENVYLNSVALAEALFGEHMMANMLILGAAYQVGAVPISAEAIERAIALNGVAVEANVQAFRWGRHYAIDSKAVLAAAGVGDGSLQSQDTVESQTGAQVRPEIAAMIAEAGLEGEVRRLAEIRASELVAYQGTGLARRYLDFVAKVVEAEQAAVPGRTRFSEAVARYLFKLMAYKDEYEVARLHLQDQFKEAVSRTLPEHSRLRYHLHPPALRSLGMKRKLKLGRWFNVPFRALRALRRVRGTPLDVFGYHKIRRLERALIDEYRALIDRAVEGLSAETYEDAAKLAELPDLIRGYESIKLRNVERFRAEVAALGY